MDNEILLTRINDYIARYRLFVEQENRANRYNVNIRAETFFIPILRVLFDCPNLENINIEKNNAPGIDLGDKKKRIAFQVTSQKSSPKVVDTLSQFLKNEDWYEKFDRLIIFMIQDRQGTYSASRIPELVQEIKEKNFSFDFEIDSDIVDLSWISGQITNFSIEHLKNLLHLFMMEVDGDFISPLSKYSNKHRLFDDIDLFGEKRKGLFQEILQKKDDVLIVGPPGIGKTFILQKVAQQKKAYFITNESKYNLARAIDLLRPEIIFVDDAHKKLDLLENVCQLRNLIDWKFRIIVTSWPTEYLAQVRRVGNFQDSQINDLELFTRDEIADLIAIILEKENASRDYRWEQLIVEYANGLPGVAVILLDNCIKTGGKEVFEGASILAFLTDISLETRSSIEWIKTKKILAYISLFGGQGVRLPSITKIISIPTIEIDILLESYRYSGIITEEAGRYRVRPRALRAVLVKEEFFGQSHQRFGEFDQIINSENYVEEIIDVILDSIHIGGFIPLDYLYQIISKTRNEIYWERFFWLFPEMIQKGISDYPEIVDAGILPGLENHPKMILPIIFDIASTDKRPLHSHPDHVLRKLKQWIQVAPHSADNIEKRKLIIEALEGYRDEDVDPETIIDVIQLIISPVYESIEELPGSGNTIKYGRGLLPINLLNQFPELWDQLFLLLSEVPIRFLNKVIDSLYDWIYPSRVVQGVSGEYISEIRKIGEHFILGFGSLVQDHPALFRQVQQLYSVLEKELNIDESNLTLFQRQVFDKLFPPRDEYIENISDKEQYSVEGLAQELLKMGKDDAIKHILWARNEANLGSNPWPDLTGSLFSSISKMIGKPLEWVESMCEFDLDEYVFPFIKKAIENHVTGWREPVEKLLGNEKTSHIAIQLVLGLENPPSDLLENVEDQINNINPEWLRWLVAQDQVSLSNIQRLLCHDSERVCLAAAIGEWLRNPEKQIREYLQNDWERVISEARGFEHQLMEIFKEYKKYALGWTVGAYFSICDQWSPAKVRLFQDVILILDIGNREQLIECILEHNLQNAHEIELIKLVVGNNVNLYKYILENCDLGNQRFYLLAPLNRVPDEEVWPEMALKAVDSGVSVDEIIQFTVTHEFNKAFFGPESKRYEEYIKAFNKLSKNEDKTLRKIAEQGLIKAKEKFDRCLKRELDREIYGWER